MNMKRLVLVSCLFLLTACAGIEIRDDGSATVSIDGCDGLHFNIIVEQKAPPGSPYPRQEGHNRVAAMSGKLNFNLNDPKKFDFSQEFTLRLSAEDNVDSDSCRWAGGNWEFTGVLAKEGGVFKDTYKVELKSFHQVP